MVLLSNVTFFKIIFKIMFLGSLFKFSVKWVREQVDIHRRADLSS